MPYRFATTRQNYADYAGGKVFYSLPGQPAFPVRLTREIFQRCQAICQARGNPGPYTLYDPCCGGAYHLCVLAYLHGEAVNAIIASDIDADALALAQRNLALLTVAGIEHRISELDDLWHTYHKSSHADALSSARRLQQRLLTLRQHISLDIHTFQADATQTEALAQGLPSRPIDIVFTDIPYGQLTTWQGAETTSSGSVAHSAVWQLLDALRPQLSSAAIIAIASDKRQKIAHPAYQREERFQIGKRRVEILSIRE